MSGTPDTSRLGKGLRKALKLAKRKQGKHLHDVPSIFIESSNPPATTTNISRVSLLSDFGPSRFDLDKCDASTPRAPAQSVESDWPGTFLPAKSLSQLNLSIPYAGKASPAPVQPAIWSGTIPTQKPKLHQAPSYHSLRGQFENPLTPLPSLKPSRSTLRIPTSRNGIPNPFEDPLTPLPSLRSSFSILRIPTGDYDLAPNLEDPLPPLPRLSPSCSTLRIPSSGQDTTGRPVQHDRIDGASAHSPYFGSNKSHHQLPNGSKSNIKPGTTAGQLRPVPRLRKLKSSQDLRRKSANVDISLLNMLSDDAKSISSNDKPQSQASVHSISHFGSFCVLDTYAPGCPVSATSEDLRYNMEIGNQFYLNVQELMEGSVDMVTGTDTDGNEIVHLTLFCPLISTDDGQVRFVLACLVNVTDFIRDAANEPNNEDVAQGEQTSKELEPEYVAPHKKPIRAPRWAISSRVSLEPSCERFENDPISPVDHSSFSSFNTQLDDESLLGGCILPEDSKAPKLRISTPPEERPYRPAPLSLEQTRSINSALNLITIDEAPKTSSTGDIWLDLADQESKPCETSPLPSPSISPSNTPSTTPTLSPATSSSTLTSTTSTPSPSSLDTLLSTFMTRLQTLYSHIFLLSLSPLSATFYEMHNVSPALYASGSYVTGHFRHTSPDVMAELGRKLDKGQRFRIERLRWGGDEEDEGREMQCYCVPVWGRKGNMAFVCVLVDLEEGLLW